MLVTCNDQCLCIQSNISTKVSHWELQKWPLLTGGLCSERQKVTYPIFMGQIKNSLCEQETMSLCTDFTVIEFVFKLRKEHVNFDFSLYI